MNEKRRYVHVKILQIKPVFKILLLVKLQKYYQQHVLKVSKVFVLQENDS